MPENTEVEVFVGLGSNLGQPIEYVKAGLAGLEKIKGYRSCGVSSPYITAPVGPQDQPPFVNAVAHGIFSGKALDLLQALLDIEQSQGRKRIRRWGPRTLDLDLLLFGDQIINLPNLVVPHPEMHHRVFVLAPLAEIAPNLVLPKLKKTALALLGLLKPSELESQKAEKSTWEYGT